jgi:G3E family GTPase
MADKRESDVGSVNIDASLIEGSDGQTVNLANGCVCCSISGGFSEALSALSQPEPPPEHVVIEASGVAGPAKVGYFGSQPPDRLDDVAVVVDAETIRQRAADKYVGDTVLRQLAGADIIVLNKTDLVDADQQAELRTWLHQQVPDARFISTCYGELPLALLLGPRGDGIPSLGPHDHDHGDEYASWSLASDTPVRETTFRAADSAFARRGMKFGSAARPDVCGPSPVEQPADMERVDLAAQSGRARLRAATHLFSAGRAVTSIGIQ